MTVVRLDLHPRAVRVLLALSVHPGATLTELAHVVGLRSASTVQLHLLELRRLGLVDWEDGKHGTLRALVAPGAVGQYPSTGSSPTATRALL